jgi:hypothetical protein
MPYDKAYQWIRAVAAASQLIVPAANLFEFYNVLMS